LDVGEGAIADPAPAREPRSPQRRDQPRDFAKQIGRIGRFGQREGGVAAATDDGRAELDQLFPAFRRKRRKKR